MLKKILRNWLLRREERERRARENWANYTLKQSKLECPGHTCGNSRGCWWLQEVMTVFAGLVMQSFLSQENYSPCIITRWFGSLMSSPSYKYQNWIKRIDHVQMLIDFLNFFSSGIGEVLFPYMYLTKFADRVATHGLALGERVPSIP